MCFVGGCYKIIQVKDDRISVYNILLRNWVDVMDQDSVKDFSPLNPKVTSVVSSYHSIASSLPLLRAIERLVQISIESKSFFTNGTLQLQIPKTLFKCW
jgi:hypothetical protein